MELLDCRSTTNRPFFPPLLVRVYFIPLLQDFTIDGQVWDDDLIGDVDEDNASDAYRDSLLHVGGECFYSGKTFRGMVCLLAGWGAHGRKNGC